MLEILEGIKNVKILTIIGLQHRNDYNNYLICIIWDSIKRNCKFSFVLTYLRNLLVQLVIVLFLLDFHAYNSLMITPNIFVCLVLLNFF